VSRTRNLLVTRPILYHYTTAPTVVKSKETAAERLVPFNLTIFFYRASAHCYINSISVSLSVCPSVRPSVSLSVCLSVRDVPV